MFKYILIFFGLFPMAFAGPLLKSNTAEEIKSKYAKAVVKLVTYYQGQEISYGTGFFVSPDGLLVSNFHVLQFLFSGDVQLEIIPYQGPNPQEYQILHCSDERTIDLCLLKVNFQPSVWFELHDNPSYEGQNIYKIGHGAGLDFHLSSGLSIVRESSLTRLLGVSYQQNNEVEFLEVSAPLFPGDSGGPLFDDQGKIMGMSTLKILKDRGKGMGIAAREIYHYYKKWKSAKDELNQVKFRSLTKAEAKAMVTSTLKKLEPPDHLLLTHQIPMENLSQLLQQDVLIVDVRALERFNQGHIPGAINIPYLENSKKTPDFIMAQDQFPYEKIQSLLKTKRPVFLYSENSLSWESYKAAKILRVLGNLDHIYWSKGGWREWRGAFHP